MSENENQKWLDEKAHSTHDAEDANVDKRTGARGTAAMDAQTRQEVARKGGLAVSRNRQHMAEIGRKGGQAVSKNREHMAKIGRKGGAASRGTGKSPSEESSDENSNRTTGRNPKDSGEST
jgi:general stress protein YciG